LTATPLNVKNSGRVDIELFAEINALEAELAPPKPGAILCRSTPELESRRNALMARHLGFTPKLPLSQLQVIGDSHVAFFSGTTGIRFYRGRSLLTGFFRLRHINIFTQLLPAFRCFHLGPSTAWNAGAKGSSTRTFEKIKALLRHDLSANSDVLLSFGEIDCRVHLPRLILQGRSVEAVVEATVARLLILGKTFRAHGCRVSFWGPPCVAQIDENKPVGDYSVSGSFGLRSDITRQFGATLAEACQSEGFGCAVLAGNYHLWGEKADPSYLLPDLSHLSQRAMPLALKLLCERGIIDVPPSVS